jgi:PKD repeat protein
MRSIALNILLVALCITAYAQHNVDFTIQPTGCRNEILALNNNSDPGQSVSWNFCANTLDGTYTTSPYGIVVSSLSALEIVEDNGKWYGFAISRDNKLVRMDFGADPFARDYTLTQLGNPGNLFDQPDGLSIAKDGDSWYGLVPNLTNEITRLKWTALDQPPVATSLNLSSTGKLSSPSQVEIEIDNNEFIAVVANGTRGSITRINFHATLANNPANGDITESMVFPGASLMYGVTVSRQCNTWEIYTIASEKIYRVVIPTLTSTITSGDITEFSSAFPFNLSSFNRIRSFAYLDRTYIYITSFGGEYIKGASWQTGASAPEMVDTGTSVAPPHAYSLAAFQNDGQYGLYIGSFDNGAINAIRINQSCSVNKRTSDVFQPRDIFYTTAASNRVGVSIKYSDGQTCSKTQDIVIKPLDAPDLDFSVTGICKNVPSVFTPISSQSITVNWNYGDATASAGGSHTYATAGDYEVHAVAASSNSCSNHKYKTISIYNSPVAGFTVPSGQVCTNNEYTFSNALADTYNGNLSYQWKADNVDVSTQRDLKFAFTSTSDHSIKLITSIPGCSDVLSQNVTVSLPGPTAGFNVVGQCATRDISFTNSSSGDILGYQWDFGDGNTTSSTSPTHVFENIGVFPITLKTSATNGCISTATKDVAVYSQPAPTFTIDLPPFSCSGTPSQFHDITGSFPDSNIQTWNWTFGDTGTGTGKNPTHTYATAGPYNVNLSVTTDKGCSGNVTQPVTITQSPTAAFDIDPACINQTTKLKDTSTGTISGWQWKIGTVTYNTQNPTHTFTVSGGYSVQLNVTGQNNCVNTITKQVVVPVVAIPDFAITNACADQPTKFIDITSSNLDPVAEHNWTFNNNGNATGAEVEFAFPTGGSFSTLLQIKTQAGCVYSTSKNVTIHPSPVPSFNVSDDSGPSPLNVSFTNTSSGAISYQWNFKDGSATTAEVSPSHTFIVLGDYSVDLIATNTDGCSKTASRVISVVDPKNELALEDFTLVKPSGSNSYRGYVRVRNNGNYSIDGFYITYGVGGGLLLKESVVASLGKGEVATFQLDNEFLSPGPSAYICAELDNDTDILDNKACETFDHIAVILGSYPNPADVYLNIESILPQAGPVHVRLYASSGGLAYDRSFDAGVGLSRLSLDVQNLAPGIYIAVITAGVTTTSHRILIAR